MDKNELRQLLHELTEPKKPQTPKNGDANFALLVGAFLLAAIAISNLAPRNSTPPVPTQYPVQR